MIKGGEILFLGGCLAATACAQTQSVKVRAIADPAAKIRFGGGLLADAQAQLALGDVGIALETFRTLSRQQPENPDAYSGIAACYAAMGRYDIARQNYELALAYAPNDPALLTALASSLERLGEADQAAQVRIEAARLRAGTPLSTGVAQTAATPLFVPRLSSVTVKLPAPSPVAAAPVHPAMPSIAARQNIAANEKPPMDGIAAPDLTPPTVKLSSAPLVPENAKFAAKVEVPILAPVEARNVMSPAIAPHQPAPAEVRISSAALVPNTTELAAIALVSIAAPVVTPGQPSPALAIPRPKRPTVKLSPLPFAPAKARPPAGPEALVPAKELSQARASPVQERRPVMPLGKPHDAIIAMAQPRNESGPHLQRLSMGEVSLVTNPPPPAPHSWPRLPQMALPAQSEIVKAAAPNHSVPKLASASALRWVPLKYASAPVNIQLLNAGRIQSLAARNRVALLDRGWRKIGIGNARFVSQRTLVLYSPARASIARRLAEHFRCRSLSVRGIQNVIVLLGRDATFARRSSARA